jgi:hypothetical protein
MFVIAMVIIMRDTVRITVGIYTLHVMHAMIIRKRWHTHSIRKSKHYKDTVQ